MCRGIETKTVVLLKSRELIHRVVVCRVLLKGNLLSSQRVTDSWTLCQIGWSWVFRGGQQLHRYCGGLGIHTYSYSYPGKIGGAGCAQDVKLGRSWEDKCYKQKGFGCNSPAAKLQSCLGFLVTFSALQIWRCSNAYHREKYKWHLCPIDLKI